MTALDMAAQTKPLHVEAETYPRPGYAAYALVIFMLVGFFVFLDRQILTLLVAPIRHDLRISDVQISLLQGMAFVILNSLAGLPIGWLVDRISRRNLLIVGFLFWTSTTLLCGMTASFAGLFAARLGLGLGAAAYDPAVFSMVTDYVPPAQRSRAMAAIAVGLSLGAGGSLVIGGFVIGNISNQTSLTLPLLGTFTSWHLVFLMIAIPGFLVAPLLLTVREPKRHETALETDGAGGSGAAPRLLPYLASQRTTFLFVYGSYTSMAVAIYAFSIWSPTFLIRAFAISPRNAGFTVGAVATVGAVLGAILGGIAADRWAARGRLDGRFRITLVSSTLLIAGAMLSVWAPNATVAIAGIGVVMFGGSVGLSSSFSVVPELVPNRLRGQAVAINSLLVNLLGLGLGPTAVAAVTDYLLHDDAHIGTSLLIVSVPALLLSLLLTFMGSVPYCRTRRLMQVMTA